MKYKPKPTVKTTNFTERNELLETSPTTTRPTYAEMLKNTKNPSIKTSKTNLKNIHGKLRSLSQTIRIRRQGNIPSRNNSNTNMAKDDNTSKKLMNLKKIQNF